MDKQKLYDYYINKDYNCAEAVLRTANEEYGLGLTENALRLVSGYGGGMGCGKTCGALSSVMAVVSSFTVGEKAHATEGFGPKCAEFCQTYETEMGSTDCSVLKEKNTVEGQRCFKTVEDSYRLMEEFLISEGKLPAEKR